MGVCLSHEEEDKKRKQQRTPGREGERKYIDKGTQEREREREARFNRLKPTVLFTENARLD